MHDVSPNSSTIRVEGDFSGFTPEELFNHLVKPELLVKWWPREATVEPRVGGAYAFSWPQQGWLLRGTYSAFEPGRKLAFTWEWSHEPGTYQVEIEFTPSERGGHMVINMGTWPQDQEAQEQRQGIIEGWMHFGMRLAGLRRGDAS